MRSGPLWLRDGIALESMGRDSVSRSGCGEAAEEPAREDGIPQRGNGMQPDVAASRQSAAIEKKQSKKCGGLPTCR